MTGSAATRMNWEGPDADFLRWVADWLDLIDPILKQVFARPTEATTAEERLRIVEWLSGNDVQDRLRAIAAGNTELGVRP